MTSFDDLTRLVELIIRHRLETTQTLFMEIEQWNKAQRWLKNLGSSGPMSVKLPGSNPELECMTLHYGNCTFYIVQY